MESWRDAWRRGLAPVLSTAGLTALRKGLADDDPALVQGTTTSPPPLMCVQDWPCEAADAIAYAGWRGDGLRTVGEVQEHFAQACYDADQLLGEPAACRWFLNWYDNTPRHIMRRELLMEVELALRDRALAALVCTVCGRTATAPPLCDGCRSRADHLKDVAKNGGTP